MEITIIERDDVKSQITPMMICSGRNGRNATMLSLLSK